MNSKPDSEIATYLTDSFQLVGTDRSMTTEKLKISEIPQDFLKPSSFKRFLYRLSTSRDTYEVFKEINQRFRDKPFLFGDISFSIDPGTEEIEIMIEKSAARLPLTRLGSGLQQTLFLLANISYYKKKMIGVEEIELNLSPAGQRRLFENIKSLVYQANLIGQSLVTSHSPYFQNRGDVGYFEVTYDEKTLTTVVGPADKAAQENFLEEDGSNHS
jgi:AAA ATPase domain